MKQRPLSPHLQIYKPQISTTISIFHRAAGLGLCAGLVLFGWWLMAAASGPVAYDQYFMHAAYTPWGKGVLTILTFLFFFYFLAELRYIAWAFGYGFSIKTMNLTGCLVVLGSFVLTALLWCL